MYIIIAVVLLLKFAEFYLFIYFYEQTSSYQPGWTSEKSLDSLEQTGCHTSPLHVQHDTRTR